MQYTHNRFKIIPYLAVDKPSYGSEFSDPFITLVLTYITFKEHGLKRLIDIKTFLTFALFFNLIKSGLI